MIIELINTASERDSKMKKLISKRYRIHISLVTVLISGVTAHASSQWPFPCEPYPRDVAYANYLLTRMAEDPRFNNAEKTSDAELQKQMGFKRKPVTDQLRLKLDFLDDHEPYDYWVPLSKDAVTDY